MPTYTIVNRLKTRACTPPEKISKYRLRIPADLEKEYADHLQSIKDERDAMLREATARAQKREEEIVGEARAEAASIRAAAEADIAQERKKAVNDLKNEIGGMAVEIAGKVVEREINESDHQALIDEFIRNVGDAS